MIIPFCFTDRVLNNAKEFTLDSHHFSHITSKNIKKKNHSGIRKIRVNWKAKQASTNYAGLINH